MVNVGYTSKIKKFTISSKTLFDISSLTKLFVASALLRLVDKGAFDLSARLHTLLPLGSAQGGATLAELLAHEARFQAWLPLFEQIAVSERGTASARDKIIARALSAEANAAPTNTAVYSDLGYIALTRLLEAVSQCPLDQLVREDVTGPLGLSSVQFRPHDGGSKIDSPIPLDIAATEYCPWRKKTLQGEVHDDNAWSMGGVSGHAGLFATASDVAHFGAAWLQALSGSQWLSQHLAQKAVRSRASGRGLGWDTKSPVGSSAGSNLSGQAFGHLGFTGCSLWVDPERRLSIALSTNRVHFGRNNLKIRHFRPAFHDLLASFY